MGNYFLYEEEIKPIKTIVIVSGFFDPIGIHHIILFEEAKKLGDYLIIGVNSDNCGEVKKGQPTNLKNWVNNTMKKYEVDFRLENKY